MTKKDYELIARAIRLTLAWYPETDRHGNCERNGIRMAAKTLAAELVNDNPRFDTDRFLDACGV